MKTINNIKIGTKLIASFLIVSIISTVIAFVGYSSTAKMKSENNSTNTDIIGQTSVIDNVNAMVIDTSGKVYKYYLLTDAASRTKIKTDLDGINTAINNSIKSYKSMNIAVDEAVAVDKFITDWNNYYTETKNY